MEIARRLYLYVISAITLGMLTGALVTLVNIALEIILGADSGEFIGFNPIQERIGRLSLVLATIGVALPVWGLHWVLAQRSAGRVESERRSAVRALYLAGVMFSLLVLMMISGRDLVSYLNTLIFGGSAGSTLGLAQSIAGLLIGGAFWAYHANVAARDARGPTSESAAWLPRLYRYLASFIGLATLLLGIVDLIALAGEALTSSGGAISSGPRPSALASALTNVVVGAVVWASHWSWSNRIADRQDERGLAERNARNRYGYMALVIFVAVSAVLQELTVALRGVLSISLGADDDLSSTDPILAVAGAIVLALVFGAVWLAHRRFMISEAGHVSEALEMGARRVDAYIVALLGLSLGGSGLAWLIGKAITVVFSSGRSITSAGGDSELAGFLAYTLVGSLTWLGAINVISRWRSALGLGEARSTARRAYLLLAIAGSLLGGVSAMVLLLNRLFGSILGAAGPANLATELATPIGVLVMALLIAGLHYRWLRRDQRDLAIERTNVQLESMAAARAEAPAEVVPAPAPRAQRRLVVTGPAGADLGAAVAGLRAALPEGYGLDEVD
jgi:hypothetical protein